MNTLINRYIEKIDWTKILEQMLDKAVSLIFLFLLFYIAKKSVHYLVNKLLKTSLKFSNQDSARQKTITKLIENLLNYCLYFLLIYWALSILGLPVSSLLAGAGIAGVAIGMGAQGFLSDLVNGFFILLERQLDVGDNVNLTNGSISVTGIVTSVGIRTTQVRGHDGTLHFVPNRNITVVGNLSRGDMRVLIDLPLSGRADLDAVYRIVETVNTAEVPKHPEVVGTPTIIGPQTIVNGQIHFRVAVTVQNGMQSTIYPIFYKAYHDALLAAKIPLAGGVGDSNGQK